MPDKDKTRRQLKTLVKIKRHRAEQKLQEQLTEQREIDARIETLSRQLADLNAPNADSETVKLAYAQGSVRRLIKDQIAEYDRQKASNDRAKRLRKELQSALLAERKLK